MRQSLASAEKLTSDFPDAKAYQDALGFAHGYLGMLQYRLADWKTAAALLQQAFERNTEHEGDGDVQFFLAMTQWQLGDKEQARKSYDQALQWMKKNEPQNQRLRGFRAEAEELLSVKEGPK